MAYQQKNEDGENRRQLRGIARDIIVAAVTAGGVLGGQWLMKGSENLKAEASYVEALQGRIATLEDQLTTYTAANTELRIQLASVKASLDSSIDFQDLLCAVLEAQPGLNWAKVAEVNSEDGMVSFRMACFDAEYRHRFDFSKFQYIGQTDFDMWPEPIAKQFYLNDLQVYKTRRHFTSEETWENPKTGKIETGVLTKFFFSYGGLDFVIGHLPRKAPTN